VSPNFFPPFATQLLVSLYQSNPSLGSSDFVDNDEDDNDEIDDVETEVSIFNMSPIIVVGERLWMLTNRRPEESFKSARMSIAFGDTITHGIIQKSGSSLELERMLSLRPRTFCREI
jgi:hypothetical protein